MFFMLYYQSVLTERVLDHFEKYKANSGHI